MLAWVVIAPTSPRETLLFAPGSAHPAVNPLESHPCAISQDNSPKITSLRNPPGGGFGVIFRPLRPPLQVLWIPHLQMYMKINNFKPNRFRTYGKPGGGAPAPTPRSANLQLPTSRPVTCKPSNLQHSVDRANVSTPPIMSKSLPSLVIVGRPNVGKSTLFNRLTGTRRSIVTNEPGITRDRIYGKAEWRGRNLEIVDTGGIVPDDKALIPREILRQAHIAIGKAALIVLVVDSQAGLTPLDEELARLLRTTGKPFVIAVNKVDATSQVNNAAVFHRLGAPIFPIAAEHGTGVDDLLDAALAEVDAVESEEEVAKEDAVEVAIIGRPNVGKSTLLNRMAGEERSIVSPIPGTTMD